MAMLLPAIVQGQSRLDSVQRLGEVSVVANRYGEVIPSQKLSGKRLETLSSFSVADAVRYFSGVQIKDYGGVGGLKTVDIRSMGTNHLGVFYDGIQLGNAQNGQIDLGKFSLDNIEEIALHNGQRSEVLQSAKDFGSAGTIYLRTRRPRFGTGRRTNFTTTVRGGSFDLINPSALWEEKLGEGICSSLNAEYVFSSGKYPFRYRRILPDGTTAWDTTAVRQNGDIRSLRLEGGLFGLSDEAKWMLKSYFYDSERGIPGAIVNNVWKRSQRQWDRSFFVQGSFMRRFGRLYTLQVNAKYADDRMRYLNPDTTLMYVDNSFLQRELYFSSANRYSIRPFWDVGLSLDYQWNMLDANLREFTYPRRHTALAALATSVERWNLKAQASLLGTFVFEQAAGSQDKREYTPAVFLSWRPFAGREANIRSFYKRIFRMPTFNDLYYTDVGNIMLRPEFVNQYNAGFEYSAEGDRDVGLHVRADAYYNEVTDKIVAVPKGNGQYRWMMMNLGYVEIRGIDVSGRMTVRFGKRTGRSGVASLQLSYTFQRAQDFSNPADNDPEAGTFGGQIAYIPRHNGSAVAHVSWRSCDINYSFIYVGERYHNSSNIRENYEPSWYTHDLSVGKLIRFGEIKIRLSAEVNNILNQYYDVVLNYPMPGRNYKIILKIEI
jgi:outer membrane cobalamin receptor